jgi:hypothetical protein
MMHFLPLKQNASSFVALSRSIVEVETKSCGRKRRAVWGGGSNALSQPLPRLITKSYIIYEAPHSSNKAIRGPETTLPQTKANLAWCSAYVLLIFACGANNTSMAIHRKLVSPLFIYFDRQTLFIVLEMLYLIF